MSGPYEDILGLPRHVSTKHPPMPRQNRAAQFAPFAALTGYDAVIREAARHTEPRRELDPQRQQELDARLRQLLALGSRGPALAITYFQPDETKSGGAYRTAMGRVQQVLPDQGLLILEDGARIYLDGVVEIQESTFLL